MADRDEEARLCENLAPGTLSGAGFLDGDTRPVGEIIREDSEELAKFGITAREVGEKLQALTEAALQGLGAEVSVGGLLVGAEEARGVLVCPFGEGGLMTKAIVTARKADSGETLTWSLLGAHLIAAHSFFGGKGSAFRLEPSRVARFLALK